MRTIDSKECYYSLDELAAELCLGVERVSKYLKDNKFPSAFKLSPHKGGWHIPQKDVVDFMQKDVKYKKIKEAIDILENSKEEYLTVRQVAETLNKTEQTVRKYIKNKVFPNILSLPSKRGGYLIPINDVEEFLNKSKRSYSIREAAKLLGIYEDTLSKWINKDKNLFPNACRVGNRWEIPKNEVETLRAELNDSYTISEVMEKFNIARNTALNWAKNKKFPKAFKIGMEWRIPKNDLHQIRDEQLSIKDVQEILDLSNNAIYRWVNNGTFPNAKKNLSGWTIPRDDIDTFLYKKSLFCTAKEAAVMLEVDLNTVRKWARKGYFPNAVKQGVKGWEIPGEDVKGFIKKRNDTSKLSVKEVATRLGYTKETIQKWLKDDTNNVFPNAYKTSSGWIIPEDDFSIVFNQIKQHNKKVNITELREKTSIKQNGNRHTFNWNPENIDGLKDLVKRIKNVLESEDLKAFSIEFKSNERSVTDIVKKIYNKEFKDFIFDICKKTLALRSKELTYKNDLISASRIYKILSEGSVEKGIESESLSEHRTIIPFLRELIIEFNNVNENNILKSVVELDCEQFWKLSVAYYSPRLVIMLSNKYNIEFERYVRYCGDQIKKQGKFIKVMGLVSYCFYGEINANRSSGIWQYCKDMQIFYEVVNDIHDYLLHSNRDNYNYKNDKWNVLHRRIDAMENRTLDFSNFHKLMKDEVKDYIKDLLRTNESRLKIQSRLNGIKKVYEELVQLYDDLLSFVDINYFHVQHLITHFQNLKDNQGNRLYKLSTIRGFFTEMRLFYDWLLEREEFIEGEKVNPFRRYSFVNIESYIENTEYIPEEVITQLEKHLEELPDNFRNAWLIMMNTGMRISDVLELEDDCYDYDNNLNVYILRYIPQKVKKRRLRNGLSEYHEIPVDKSIIECIKKQIEDTKDLRLLVTSESYKKHIFLISNGYNITIPYSSDITENINSIVDKYDIRDENGNKFHYTNHMCRKTVIVDLLSKGLNIQEVADYVGHLSIRTTERSYREVDQKKIAELDLEFFDELFDETIGVEIKEQFSFEERKSLMAEIKLGVRETPEGHGHCAKHVSFGPCVKKSCVGCKMLVTGPQKLPMWRKLYNEQKTYMRDLEEEYQKNGVSDFKTHRMYQQQERLLQIYKDTIEQVTTFAVKRGIPIEENN